MWSTIAKWAAQFLLLPLAKEIATWIRDYVQRKIEQRNRHRENKKKIDDYDKSPASNSSDDFTRLP